jgi:hypothetical protein
MSTSLVVERYLPGLTLEQSGAKAPTASRTSERTCATTPIAPRRHDAEASVASAWLMIGTILGCLVTMMSVVLVAATSMP